MKKSSVYFFLAITLLLTHTPCRAKEAKTKRLLEFHGCYQLEEDGSRFDQLGFCELGIHECAEKIQMSVNPDGTNKKEVRVKLEYKDLNSFTRSYYLGEAKTWEIFEAVEKGKIKETAYGQQFQVDVYRKRKIRKNILNRTEIFSVQKFGTQKELSRTTYQFNNDCIHTCRYSSTACSTLQSPD